MLRVGGFRALWAALWAVSVGLGAGRAEACAACDSGDPTLTALGTEQPFAGRLRSALALRYRTDAIGVPGVDRSNIRELRADLSSAWAPSEGWFIVANLPFIYRRVSDDSLAESEVWGLGDAELDAKWFAWQDRAFAPRQLLAFLGGVELPTGAWQKDAAGDYLPLEVQPGSGSLDLVLGASLTAFWGPASGWLSLRWLQPLLVRDALQPGSALWTSLALQHQLTSWLALRLGSELRWDQQSEEAGQPDPNSGGTILFGSGDLGWSPGADLTLWLGLRLPLVNALHGAHDEGASVSLVLAHDW